MDVRTPVQGIGSPLVASAPSRTAGYRNEGKGFTGQLVVDPIGVHVTLARNLTLAASGGPGSKAYGKVVEVGSQHGHKLTCPLTLLLLLMPQRPPDQTPADAELASRLQRDRSRFAAAFGRSRWPATQPTRVPLGDPHQGGRRVTRLSWGRATSLTYKPRSIQTEVLWNRTLVWFARRAPVGALPAPRILARRDYGWVESLVHQRPRTAAQAREYHWQAGALLALFDILEVRDVHRDNFIAVRGHPVLVDAETIAHPRLSRFRNVPSIAQCGFFAGPASEDARAGCRSGLPGSAVRLSRYGDELIGGYQAGYQALRTHGAELFRRTGPLATLGDAAIRVVLRPTTSYRAALHGRDVAAALAAAPPPPIPVRGHPAVIRAEREALDEGDVPIFHARGDGTDLLAGTCPIVPRCFRVSALAAISNRLAGLSPKDERDNVALIRSLLALETLRAGPGTATPDRSRRRSRSR